MLTGASTNVLAEVTAGSAEAALIGVAVLVFAAGIAVFKKLRGAV